MKPRWIKLHLNEMDADTCVMAVGDIGVLVCREWYREDAVAPACVLTFVPGATLKDFGLEAGQS